MSARRDRVAQFFREETPRRALALALFLAVLILFRKLALLVVFFVVFKKILSAGAGLAHRRLRLPPKAALGVVTLLVVSLLGGAFALGVGRGVRAIHTARENLPERIATIKQAPLYLTAQEHFQDAADKVVEGAQHYASGALHMVSAFGHGVLYALIGLILALVSLLEEKELHELRERLDPRSLGGILLRWLGHVADALLVMVQFQLVVALCNAVLTLPVLLLLGLPHPVTLFVLIFVSGLVPVVGNFVSGAILSLLAWQVKGWAGVVLFVGLTFVLHKLESYYLNPRLAARHVKLPGFVLICSLILFEHLFGFAGLFLSFPTLFVAQRIRAELRAEHAADTAEPAAAEA